MHERDALLVAGPFSDQPDEALRGMCLDRTSLGDIRALAEQDPSVRAGRIQVDVLTWWVEPGGAHVSRRAGG